MAVPEDLEERIRERISMLEKASDEEIADAIEKLKADSKLWNSIPSGNRNYLETALNVFKENPKKAHGYIRGAINHLIKAAPHQLGHLAEKLKGEYRPLETASKEELYQGVLAAEIDISELSNEDLLGFAQHVESNPKLYSLEAYQGSRPAVRAIIDKYERLSRKDPAEAKRYLEEKAKSLRNIFGKTFIPNLLGKIAREYERKRE